MSFDVNHLYELLPALYRLRDAEVGRTLSLPDEGGPLKTLLALLAEQVGVLEEDLAQLYDDQFIETCAEWVVPYLGDLVGARGLVVYPNADFSQRSQVANTLSYRRRKGTAAVIEQLAHDVTGWDASVVEYFQLLATTQYMNHLRPENLAVAPLRNAASLEMLHTPFDTVTRTADVRRIELQRGKYNLPNIGIYLWRIGSYPLTQSPAFQVDLLRYTFNAVGLDAPLCNRPAAEQEITHLAEPVNVPMPLSRPRLTRDLAMSYGPDAAGSLPKSLLVWVDGQMIAPDFISICDLSNIKDVAGNDVLDGAGQPVGWVNMPLPVSSPPQGSYPHYRLAIDPVLGRLAFQVPPQAVQVSYQYGFSAEMGGGEYGRASTFSAELAPLIPVSKANGLTIQAALNQLATTGGVVEIQDNGYYLENPVVQIASGKTIELRAADEHRPILVLAGELLVIGEANAEFRLNGLLISGGRVWAPALAGSGAPNLLHTLRVRHCTLLPGASPAIRTAEGSIAAQPAGPRLVVEVPNCEVEVEQSIIGSLRVTDEAAVSLKNSLVDALQAAEVAFAGLVAPGPAAVFEAARPGASLTIQNCTVIGKVHTLVMTLASNTIFMASLAPADQWPAPVVADRLQKGCIRFSYVPFGSRVPSPYRCQPQAAADAVRVRPVFTSLRYGDAGYGQLSLHCAPEIRQGADDEAEMGAFHNLYQPQREANLRARLEEYLRFGLEAGIFYAS